MTVNVRLDLSKFNRLRAELEASVSSILDQVGRDTVAYLQQNVAGGLGGWKNRTGNLRESYGYRVEGDRLVIFNSADYAVHVENMEGYYVITGITDAGGPVRQALARAAKQHNLKMKGL